MKRHFYNFEPDDPFYDLVTILSTTVHPERMPQGYEDLKEFARDLTDDPRMIRFKAELRQVLEGDTEGLHPDAIFTAAEYDDFDTDEEFLRQLWTDLYPGEPLPQPRS